MANSEAADLMSVGQHCADPECKQIDFLPFPCSRCGKVYCLQHRMCPCSPGENTVLVCPLCAKSVIVPPGQDAELVFDRHTRTDCDPSNYARVHKKQRCPAASCKEKLTSTNSYTCRDCGVTVCLRHRLPADHKCPGKAAAAAAAAQGRLGLGSIRRMFSGSGAAPAAAAAPARQQAQPAAPSSRPGVAQRAAAATAKTKNSIQSQLQQYRQRQQQRTSRQDADVVDLTGDAATPQRSGAAAGAGPELCQQCGARFANVQQLIEHAEAAHAGGWSSGALGAQQPQQPQRRAAGGGMEPCPHCGRMFADPVELVAHVERQHTGTNCVLS